MTNLAEKLTTRHLSGPESEPITLNRKRIYILPSRYGIFFGLLLLIMLIGSINYNNSLGFALTFLMGSVAVISMLHTHRNLSGLAIKTGTTRSVFSGQKTGFPFIFTNSSGTDKLSVQLQYQSDQIVIDIPANSTVTGNMEVMSKKRGRITLNRIKVSTDYPLGLFFAWSWIIPDSSCIIYPSPEKHAPPASFENQGSGNLHTANKGQEEYFGLRHYQAGDPLKTIAWKQSARGEDLLTKQFSGTSGQTLWLEWDIVDVISIEHKLSRLCRWVLDCEAAGVKYGLRIPGNTIPPGNGNKHQHVCLTALALFTT